MLKKIVLVLTVLFCGVIVFFSIMGEKLYYEGCPQVTIADRVAIVREDGISVRIIPATALFEGKYIYTVESRDGYSAPVYTLVQHEVQVEPYDDYWQEGDYYLLLTQGSFRQVVATVTKGEPKDGIRVNVLDNSTMMW